MSSWIKMREDLHEDPAILRIAEKLRVRPEVVVGYCHRFWGWVSRNCHDGTVTGVKLEAVENVLAMPNFLHLLCEVQWLEYIESTSGPVIIIPKFDRHLSQGAKSRALTTERKRKSRSETGVTKVSRKQRDKSVTREEKRREEKIRKKEPPISPPRGTEYSEPFLRFWNAYPPKRRQGKDAAWRAWRKHVPAGLAETVIAAAGEYASSAVGQSEYVPAPTAWLNQHRWDDDRAAWGSGKKPVDWDEILKNSEVR